MKIKTEIFGKVTPIALTLGTVAIALYSVIVPQSATAQLADRVKPLEDLNNNQNEQDPLTGNNGFSVFDLIHRSKLGIDSEGFADSVNQNLDKATQEFLRQREGQSNNQPQVLPNNQTPPTSEITN